MCPAWEDRKCLNKKCPRRHPGGLNRELACLCALFVPYLSSALLLSLRLSLPMLCFFPILTFSLSFALTLTWITFPFCLGKAGSHEVLVASPLSLSMASFSGSDCDSLDFEILSDSDDEASDDKQLAEKSRLTSSSPFSRPGTYPHINQENHDPSRCNLSGPPSVMESARNALQRSSFMQNKTSSFSLSSSDTEEDTPTEHSFDGEYLYFSQASSGYGLDDMDDELNLSNQPEGFTRLLSLTDHSRHSDYELDIEKSASVGYAAGTQAASSVSPDIASVAKSSASPKKAAADGGHEPKKSSPLQVSLLHS